MILRPSTYDWVQEQDEFPCRKSWILLNDFSKLFEMRLYILVRRLNEKFVPFSRLVLADILPQEIKPVLNMCDGGFLLGQLEAALFHKLLDERLDFFFQEFFRSSCDDEIIRISCEIHQRTFSRFYPGKVFHQ